jgi:glycerol-3-phosphate acyltransferase PlsY
MDTLFWFCLGFLSGSIPYSLLLGQLSLKTDIRAVGDGNPGAFNVLRAGGWRVGLAAMLLDGFKGAIPVGVVYWGAQIQDWRLVALALAPVLGHAFSPLLHGRGGKAVATTFGIWAGLTGPEAPVVLGLLLGLAFYVLGSSGWSVWLAMLGLLAHLLSYRPDPVFIAIWLANMLLLVWKYRADLRQWPTIRPGVLARAARLTRPSG